MRLPRLLLLLAGCVGFSTILFGLLSFISPTSHQYASTSTSNRRSGLKALFSFHSPSSLFPPSALISLTDDNSTFFLARPAAFGPLLPSSGFSGQLWVGSGFGDDSLRKGVVGAEGELGCSDIPDWEEAEEKERDGDDDESAPGDVDGEESKGDGTETNGEMDDGDGGARDGTDEYLDDRRHDPQAKGKSRESSKGRRSTQHADIQSLQESAEISGKIALLSRGGCGFLEKAKWAQRRGAVALIVGDDTRGGVLFTMYASGDASNITIPSLFTSHTTAQLLSSLTSPTRYRELGRGGGESKRVKQLKSKLQKSSHDKTSGQKESGPTFTSTTSSVKSTATPGVKPPDPGRARRAAESSVDTPFQGKENPSWARSVLSALGVRPRGPVSSDLSHESWRPPRSGQIDWVVDAGEEDEVGKEYADHQVHTPTRRVPTSTKGAVNTATRSQSGDGFVIGVQDWRDPDLVQEPPSSQPTPSSHRGSGRAKHGVKPPGGDGVSGDGANADADADAKGQQEQAYEGGSNTPGSGQYGDDEDGGVEVDETNVKEHKSWLDSLLGHNHQPEHTDSQPSHDTLDTPGLHDGLWVTLTPTSMSSSPFFDTLLVLVVSPLVTLTVVYVLLIVRSRIRRRRWRAPKAVVERLPVRTYYTMHSPSTTNTPTATTTTTTSSLPATTSSLPATTTPTSTSPLLSSTRTSTRPRSQTTSAEIPPRSRPLPIPDSVPASVEKQPPSLTSSAWRRRYTGKQVECVVCLEEYVDGVSKVMSLPCGHEFHVDCITPWLTTRRRTCPICKGDVVRPHDQTSSSLASGSSSSYHDDDSDRSDSSRSPSPNTPRWRTDPEQGNPVSPDSDRRSPHSVWDWRPLRRFTDETRDDRDEHIR